MGRAARSAVIEIAHLLDTPGDPTPYGSLDPALVDGRVGLALLSGYLELAGFDDQPHADCALEHLEIAADAFGSQPPFASLFGGFPGLAWALHHLDGRVLSLEDDAVADAWPVLLGALDSTAWVGPFDLINGLVGLGVCALEALPVPAAAEVAGKVVDRLADAATVDEKGTYWKTWPEHMTKTRRADHPRGQVNLGVAHGTPGVLGVLGLAVELDVAGDRALDLLEGAVPWLLAQALEDGPSTFPALAGCSPEPARLAWCYGDAGIAVTLLGTARRARRADWERAALDIALKAARRPDETTEVSDPGLCHGAVGLGHLFNRLFQATGHPELAAAAQRWFRRALDYRNEDGVHIAGFWTVGPPGDDGRPTREARPGFLTGAAGFALALLAATTDVEPLWDRLLLASIPFGTEPRRPPERSS
ncbi:MAG: lanthionine synthetase C family protein [Acidobacteriota bacterium]